MNKLIAKKNKNKKTKKTFRFKAKTCYNLH